MRWGSSCGSRTLFVSDLDFTLLRSDATLSARTTDVVNQLVANHNDVPLFEIADHGCAVANAIAELITAASEVIPSNDDDGVARWLDRHVLVQSAVP